VRGFHSFIDEASPINEDYISVYDSVDLCDVIYGAVKGITGKHVSRIYDDSIWDWSLAVTCPVVSGSKIRPFSIPPTRGRQCSESFAYGNVNVNGWLSSRVTVVDNKREWNISGEVMFRILVCSNGSYPSSLALLKSPSAIQHSNEGYESQSPGAEREALSSIGASIPTPLTKLAGVAAIAIAVVIAMFFRRFRLLAFPVWLFSPYGQHHGYALQ
jgi:hypothetical protein